MSSFFDSGPLPDFKEIQKWLGREIPWKLAERWEKAQNNDWLNRYVQDMMEKAGKAANDGVWLRTDTVKDDKHVTVTLHPSKDLGEQDLRLFAATDRLRVTAGDGRKRIVRFPCLVYPRTGKVLHKDGKLIAKFKRRRTERDEVELFIQP
ncbi:hypothetical protein [Cohnella zeiphila]|uniref:Uncharacterized protein n=1 Tax=Cohnella zeiphila TaxID=2761120 RepID=A0A7X0VV00_9BACL|nr:hypothetical protein [Cohnella zeiphila]MBB6731604.1 hypothetical protein [Cohnella zeiphila]